MFTKEYGVIEDAKLYIEDHSCLTLDIWISLDNGGKTCLGGWSLAHADEPYIRKNFENGDPTNYAGYYITKVLKVAGVKALNDVVGKPIRAIIDNERIIGIQSYMGNDFFIPNADKSKIFEKEENGI